jgi:transmembrane sensor
MNQKKFNKILKRYLSGKATEEEKQMVDAWYEQMGDKSLELMNDAKEEELEQYYWTSITDNMRKIVPTVTDGHTVRTKSSIIRYSVGIAASVMLIMFSYLFLLEKKSSSDPVANDSSRSMSWEKIINTKNITQRYVLTDGSKIMLEPGSSIQIQAEFNMSCRDVKLIGKAFFEVAHNPQKPFRVFANGVTTKVLGTSFMIRAYENDKDVVVAVKTGRVSIYKNETDTKKSPEIILTPNQQIVYDKRKKTIAKGIVEVPQPLIKEEEIRRLRFDAAPVAEIFLAMEKIYGVHIVFDEETYSSCKLTTSLANGGLYDRLNIVTSAIGATYSIQENVIVISGNGCD